MSAEQRAAHDPRRDPWPSFPSGTTKWPTILLFRVAVEDYSRPLHVVANCLRDLADELDEKEARQND